MQIVFRNFGIGIYFFLWKIGWQCLDWGVVPVIWIFCAAEVRGMFVRQIETLSEEKLVYIKKGSIFDEKCDLIILPCSSNGGVTRWVQSEIERYHLPFPATTVPYGSVMFLETGTAYAKANYVAYAASVDNRLVTSSLEKIRRILEQILSYSEQEEISLVNIPVLGTGAGKLGHAPVIALYEDVFGKSAVSLNVYIPDSTIAELFLPEQFERRAAKPTIDNPRVFISYSWGRNDVQEWCFELAKRLRLNGVNARIDRFNLKAGFDLPQWMTDEIFKADKVLLVCDSNYADKANGRKAGVGWETMIVQGDMLSQGLTNKYIAIAYGDFDKNVPIYMKAKLAISKDSVEKDFETLLLHIFELDIAPPLGEIPNWIRERISNRSIADELPDRQLT